jgi:N-ethylmaleimide reductase
MSNLLFSPTTAGAIPAKNRIVMAPMTRSRAIGNRANSLMATYYGQRASAGLIITEGVSPDPDGLGYARMPGLFTNEQQESWRQVIGAVHAGGGKIVVQLMHSGRIGHQANLPEGAELVGPSALQASGQIFVDGQGMQPFGAPRALTLADIAHVKAMFVASARRAVAAGFDGVELHAANGYLLEQFLNPVVNQRTDEYGGSMENRTRLVVEIAREVAAAVGADRLGVRISPHGALGDLPAYEGVDQTYHHLADELSRLKIAYLHVTDHGALGGVNIPAELKQELRRRFGGALILNGGYDRSRAEAELGSDGADLIAFGRPFLANPDLVTRLKTGTPLAQPDMATLYTPGPEGYVDLVPVAA